jgi:DNA-binding beta-propeller fold protein YncE
MRVRLAFALGLVATLVLTTSGTWLGAQGGGGAAPYVQVSDILIGGPLPAQWDYLNVDSAGKRLYVSHGNAEVVVIDTATEKVVGRITDTPGVHGIAIAPNGKGFTSNGRENKVSIVDLKTLQTSSKTDVGVNPDAIMYEPKQKEIYAFNHTGKSATVINPDSGAVVATIPLSGTVETGQSDPGLGRVFVNIEDKDSIDVIDVATHKVVASWPVAPGDGPTGMAIDTATHRLLVGANKFMVMLDASNGKVVASVPICAGTDATWFDPGTKLAFSSCRDGKITVAHMDAPDKLSVVQTITTAPNSKTMALDAVTHKLYVAGAKPAAADPNAPAAGARGRGPQNDPNSFHVFVFGMKK